MLSKEQRKKYDEVAQKVASGKLGYIPAQKSKYSKCSTSKFSNHKVQL